MKKEKISYKTEEQKEMMKFLTVLLVVIGIIIIVYGLSKVFIKEEAKELTYQTGSVSTDVTIVGTMFNNPEKEYYVLAYDTKGNNAQSYVTYANYYTTRSKEPIKIYYLDLSSGFNSNYYVKENSNKNAQNYKDLKMLDGTLIKISSGKITKYIEGLDNIQKELEVKEK